MTREYAGTARFTHDDDDHAGHLYYVEIDGRHPPPYTTQRRVDAIIDVAPDGTLAGIELIDKMPPPPKQPEQRGVKTITYDPEKWTLVPRDPTLDMIRALTPWLSEEVRTKGAAHDDHPVSTAFGAWFLGSFIADYRAMLDAAPQPKQRRGK